MDGERIIRSVAEGDISSLLEDVEEYLKLIHKNVPEVLTFIRNFLKAVLMALKPLQQLSSKEVTITHSIISCLEWIKRHLSDASNGQVEYALYYVIERYLNLKQYEEAVKFSCYLWVLLDNHIVLSPKKTDLQSIANNIMVLFRKAAGEVGRESSRSSRYSAALQLQTTALTFCTLCPEEIPAFGSKVHHALAQYCDEKNEAFEPECVVSFLGAVWCNMLSKSSSRTVTRSQKFLYFQTMHTCDNYLSRRAKYLEIAAHFPKWLLSLKDLKCEESNSTNGARLLELSINLSVLYIELLVSQKCMPLSLLLEWNELLNDDTWSVEETEMIYLMCSFMTTRVYVSVVEQARDDTRLQYIAAAKELATLFCRMFKASNAFSLNFVGQYNSVIGIGNLGIVCFKKCLYEDAIQFLTISIDLQPAQERGLELEGVWKKQELLICCYTVEGMHMEALVTVARVFSLHTDKLSSCVKLWLKAKKAAHHFKKDEEASVAKITICDIAEKHKIQLNKEKCIQFLMKELKLCNYERRNIDDECSAVVCWLLKISVKLDRARAIVLAVECYVTHQAESFHTSVLSRSDDLCEDALKIFQSSLVENPDDISVKLDLSLLYFWMYHVKWIKQQQIAKEEIEKPVKVLVPDEDDPSGHVTEERDKDDKCDVTTRFASVTAAAEMKLLAILSNAVSIWLEFSTSSDRPWSKVLDLEEDLNILNIVKATAKYFAQSANDYHELRALVVLRDVAKSAHNHSFELAALHSMLSIVTRLGYLNVAGTIVSHVELNLLADDNLKDDCFHAEKLKFYLAKSYYFLQSEQFHPGLDLLLRILKDPFLELNQRTPMFIKAEAQLLSSMYLLLPPAAFSYGKVPATHFLEDTPIRLAVESLKIALRLVKYQSKVPDKKSSYGTDFSYAPDIICLLLRCAVMVGKLYMEIGAPREARCFLQECLLVSQKLILTYWSSKILITLARVDLLCDNLEDCEMKLSGLKYMLKTSSGSSVLAPVPRKNLIPSISPDGEDEPSPNSDFLTTRSGRSRKGWIRQQMLKSQKNETSPVMKWRTKREDFGGLVVHPESCACQYCEFYTLQMINLETAYLNSQYMLAKGNTVEACAELEEVLKAHKIIAQKSDVLKPLDLITDFKVGDPGAKVLRESDLSVFVHSLINMSQICMERGDFSTALSHVTVALDRLNSCAKYSKHLHANLYGSLVYCKVVILIRILGSSETLTKSASCLANTWFGGKNSPVNVAVAELLDEFSKLNFGCETPKDRKLPIIDVLDMSGLPCENPSLSAQLCKAPVKRDLLSSAMKNCLSAIGSSPKRSYLSSSGAPFCLNFSNSGDDCAFASPSNSESDLKDYEQQKTSSSRKAKSSAKSKKHRSTKVCSTTTPSKKHLNAQGLKKRYPPRKVKGLVPENTEPKQLAAKSNGSPEIVFKFFKSKRNFTIKSSEDIWSQTLGDSNGNQMSASDHSARKKKVKTKASCGKTAMPSLAPRRSARAGSRTKSSENAVGSEVKGTLSSTDLPEVVNEHISSKPSKSRLFIYSSDDQQQAEKVDDYTTVEKARGIGVPVSQVKNSKQNSSSGNSVCEEWFEKEEAKFSIPRSSVTEPYTPKFVGIPYEQQNYSAKTSFNAVANLDFVNTTGVKVDELIFELKEAISLLEHHPPCPLYANICLLLALLSSSETMENSDKNHENKRNICYLVSESFAVTLRHQSIIRLSKMMRDLPENIKTEKKAVLPHSESEEILLKVNVTKQRNLHFSKWMADDLFSDRMKQLQSALPAEWTVVQVHGFPEMLNIPKNSSKPQAPKLVVCQYRRDSPPCVSVIDNNVDALFTTNFLSLFENIIHESSLTMTNKDAKKWWTLRRSLDNQMKELTDSMENTWLGCWKGLFLGLPSSKERSQQLHKAVLQVTSHAHSLGCRQADKEMLQVILDSASLLSRQQLATAVSRLWNLSSTDSMLQDLTKYIHNLSASFVATNRNPVLLILDKHVQALPWESMSMLKDVPVTRVPSVALLGAQLESYSLLENAVLSNGVQSEKSFYIVNPAGDLLNTQEMFEEIFRQQKGWKGIFGRIPTSEEFKSAITDHDLFLYLGHGTGKNYLIGESIEKHWCQAATLLMGCSSGRLKLLGRQLEPAGVVLQYFLGGSPCVVANLWDVTDKDIDRFTHTLLETWLPNYGKNSGCSVNVASAISTARSSCKLPFLIGSAPVVYGLPIFTKS